jgi:HSP20 family protein
MLTTTWQTVSNLDRFIDDVMGSALGAATNPRTFNPAVDVRASDNEVRVICDVPGVKREDLDITLENRVLTIKGSRSFESNANEQVMLERSYGEFQRQFAVPDSLDDTNLSANLTNGVLTVCIPKQLKARPVKIRIESDTDVKQFTE